MVSFTTSLTALVLAAAACARPTPVTLKPRQAAAPGDANMDVLVAKFALTLEELESAFYREAISKNSQPLSNNLLRRAKTVQTRSLNDKQIALMEKIFQTEDAHATALQQALSAAGGPVLRPCKYKFDTSSAATILQTATLLEEVGQAAYQGAAPLLQDKALLAKAASILTVEAQHSTVLRVLGGRDPVPRAFTNSLNPPEVSTLIEGFIESCEDASNPLKLVPPNPQLQLQPSAGPPPNGNNNPLNQAGVQAATFLRFAIASGGEAAVARQATGAALPSINEAKFCVFPGGSPDQTRFVDYSEPQGCQRPDDLVLPGLVMLARERDVGTVIAGPVPILN
ncbi:hypothetical protein CDD80_649 [Ophiocordyceps camponoti-rufipedis]|uniref:Ferritin-like diiron domain-containing protein n=1 Tax=Ophiocordyceps camponoti-rufipedis TaxID=2004952 RepID=A0A2C5ZDB0_9HYPO|nr:hypothetical protein CDD80_649 [Ophiocordyceps camponoti-rufipedis]